MSLAPGNLQTGILKQGLVFFFLMQAGWRTKAASDKQRAYLGNLVTELQDAIGTEAMPKDLSRGLPKKMTMRDVGDLLAKLKFFPATPAQKEALTVSGFVAGGVIRCYNWSSNGGAFGTIGNSDRQARTLFLETDVSRHVNLVLWNCSFCNMPFSHRVSRV
jgi:hypothetical protein